MNYFTLKWMKLINEIDLTAPDSLANFCNCLFRCAAIGIDESQSCTAHLRQTFRLKKEALQGVSNVISVLDAHSCAMLNRQGAGLGEVVGVRAD